MTDNFFVSSTSFNWWNTFVKSILEKTVLTAKVAKRSAGIGRVVSLSRLCCDVQWHYMVASVVFYIHFNSTKKGNCLLWVLLIFINISWNDWYTWACVNFHPNWLMFTTIHTASELLDVLWKFPSKSTLSSSCLSTSSTRRVALTFPLELHTDCKCPTLPHLLHL